MKYLRETGYGFFWGLGFSFVIVIAINGFDYFFEAQMREKQKQDYIEIVNTQVQYNLDALKPEVVGFKAVNGNVVVSLKAQNFNVPATKIFYRLSLISDKNPDFVSICTQPLVYEAGGSEYIYYQTSCRSIYYPANEISKVIVKPAINNNL